MNKEVLYQTTEQIERIKHVLANRPYANHGERLPGTILVSLEDLAEILLEQGVIAANPAVTFFSHDGESFEFHQTHEAAVKAAEIGIERFQEKLADGDGYDIESDGDFNNVCYGLVLRSSCSHVDYTVTEEHHANGDFQQWPVGTDILRLGLDGLSYAVNPTLYLNAPAQVGKGVFREGVAWETVVNAAIRNYRHEQSKEKSKPIVSSKQLMQIAMGDLILVPKTPSVSLLCSMAMRDRHDFGLLDDQMRESMLRDMAKLYEEATGQGFHKLGQEEENTDGLGAKHPFLNRFKGMDTHFIKLSPEDAEKFKQDLEEANKDKKIGGFSAIPELQNDAVSIFSYSAFNLLNTPYSVQSPPLDEKVVFNGVDEGYRYYSIDADGQGYYTKEMPHISMRGDYWGKDISMREAPDFGYQGDWKQSLVIRSQVISTLEMKQEVLK